MPTITLLFASLHVLLMLVLLARISRHRHGRKIGLGDGGDAVLNRKIRVHGNFVEHAPIALLLGRAMHAVGLSGSGGYSLGRFWGTALTWLVLLAMALAGLWLALR